MGIGKTIGEKLKESGKTAAWLSRKTGIPATTLRSMISRDSDKTNLDTLEKIAAALGCSVLDLIDIDIFHNVSDSDRKQLLKIASDRADAAIKRAAYISELAGYEWELLPDMEDLEEKTIYLTDKKTNVLYAVESDLFTDAVDGSADFIKFKFEKMMKSAKIVNNGK